MNLLKFKLPKYVRTQWATKELKDAWEEKLMLMRRIPSMLDRLAVFKGLRPCAVVRVNDKDMDAFKQEMADNAAFFIPTEKDRGSWLGVVSLDMMKAYELSSILKSNNGGADKRAGMLGVPECCHTFNKETGVAGYHDATWQYASNASDGNLKKRGETSIRIKRECHQHSTPMLRSIGIRILPWVPCSPDCQASIHIADELVRLGKEANIQHFDEFLNMLEMPIEWNALKGIAYVSTPLFKIEHDSVTCYPTYIVQKEGTYYPEGAPRGLKFPWNELPGRKRRTSEAIKEGSE